MDQAQLRRELNRWADDLQAQGALEVYAFGSLVYKNGEQFGDNSDVDLVVVMPDLADAAERARWLEAQIDSKTKLEGDLVRLLGRSADESIVSVLAVTDSEIRLDVHKDGHRAFFSANTFESLSSGARTRGLARAATLEADRFALNALSFSQKVRNEWFGSSFNRRMIKLPWYSGSDPIPKMFMRAAAAAACTSEEDGAEHDLKLGLDAVFIQLSKLRGVAAYQALYERISVRRGARGNISALTGPDQLLLSELIYDLAKPRFQEPREICETVEEASSFATPEAPAATSSSAAGIPSHKVLWDPLESTCRHASLSIL